MMPADRATLDALAIVAIILIVTFHGYFLFFWFIVGLAKCMAFVVVAGLLAQEVVPWLEEGE